MVKQASNFYMQIIFKHKCFQDDISDNYDGVIIVILKVCAWSVVLSTCTYHFFSGLYS